MIWIPIVLTWIAQYVNQNLDVNYYGVQGALVHCTVARLAKQNIGVYTAQTVANCDSSCFWSYFSILVLFCSLFVDHIVNLLSFITLLPRDDSRQLTLLMWTVDLAFVCEQHPADFHHRSAFCGHLCYCNCCLAFGCTFLSLFTLQSNLNFLLCIFKLGTLPCLSGVRLFSGGISATELN